MPAPASLPPEHRATGRRPWRHSRGLALTMLGLGTGPLGNLGAVVPDEEADAVLRAAWEGGVRYFDTAPHYGLGLAERRLARLLREVPRSEVVVSSKVGRLLEPVAGGASGTDDEGFVVPATHRRVWDFSRDGIRRSVEESLERLGVSHLDIAFLHDPDDHWEQASTEGMATLRELREEGVVRAIGVGMNQTALPTELLRRGEATGLDVVLVAGRFSLLDQSAQDELLPLAREHGVGVVVGGVFNSGILALPDVPDEASYQYGPASAAVLARARRVAELCRQHGTTLPTAALAYARTHPAVVSVLVGCAQTSMVEDNLARVDQEPTGGWQALWEDLTSEGLLSAPPSPLATPVPRRRFGATIDLVPEAIEEYERLHREVWPAVVERQRLANIENFSIFRRGRTLFSYLEYSGVDYEADMAALAADPVLQAWWAITDPLQRPADGTRERSETSWWTELDEICHQD